MGVELHMLPVKAGDATLLIERCRGRSRTVLIDAGLAQSEIVDYLHGIGVHHLDLVILSHPDLDHLQGLLAVIEGSQMRIGAIWCFDLGFLRHFVTTGSLPPPQPGTRSIEYARLLMSLVTHDQILKTATGRKISCLQVSEGYRINVGSLHLEVLYPWDGFYGSLRSPRALKKLLAKNWPEDWWPPEGFSPTEGEGVERTPARRVRPFGEQRAALDKLLRRIQLDESELSPEVVASPLVGAENQESEIEVETNEFPISLLGTLYNNLSIVVRVFVTGGIAPPQLLFPDDLTDWTCLVARRWFDLRADVFKFPHHGSSGPGVSRRVLVEHGWPFPWPCCSWCAPREWLIRKRFWMDRCHGRMQAPLLFCKLVRPSHTLVFPYPQKGLPERRVLEPCLGRIHANRDSQEPARLADRNNPPSPKVLRIGKERNDIAAIWSNIRAGTSERRPWPGVGLSAN